MFIEGKQEWNKFVIEVEEDSKIKDFLIDNLGFSVRSISKLKNKKNLFVNDEYKKPTGNIKKGDIIMIPIIEEPSGFNPQNLGVRCIYEDFDLLIMDKPPFMVVHPTKSHTDKTLANAVSYYIQSKSEYPKIRFVNRLDMNTSGIVVVAKNAYAHHKLSVEMSDNNVEKIYIAVVKGCIKEDTGTIDLPIYRESDDSIKRCVDDRGQNSVTHFKVIQRMKDATVVMLKLDTGRTHQIRVHLSHLGYGIIGDELYGHVDKNLIDRQALHAYKIGITQPRTSTRIEVCAELPDDIKKLILNCGGTLDMDLSW
ncbi:RluA family pseudouridine synthase [Peptostreptococcus canis]|uniref:Pseudouridine synthase n=1 Tax=Peptostreptococcus canis TaxID=1159213 RepID=A0ABR6TL21_9FIRM|nr:RluA family pseudouridine synthase [Peptostreptococcus canis]MBP1997767.1 23S rRNA pseudouridine1911/1915/1917 synthase [Peptostreptococcus canis]